MVTTTHPTTFSAIPERVRQRPQWVVYQAKPKANGKLDKVPFAATKTHCDKPTCCTGRYATKHHPASTTDPDTWRTFDEAVIAYLRGGWAGIGFVFSKDDPFFGMDLDGVADPETGEITPDARAMIDALATYTERSPSLKGIHAIGEGQLPPGGRRKGHNIELYDRGRFFTMTGLVLPGLEELRAVNGALTALHRQVFGEPEPPRERAPRTAPPLSLEDAEVLERARNAANAARFNALYDRGNVAAAGGDGSQSSADLALCNLLRFWTGANPQQMDRLFRRSALMRDKWDEKRGELTYGEKTITRALDGDVYTPPITVVFGTGTGTTEGDQAEPDAKDQEIARLRALVAAKDAELAELRAVNRGIMAIVRSEAKPAMKVANIALAVEAHSNRPEDLASIGAVARQIHQSEDTVSATLAAQRMIVEPSKLRASETATPFTVTYETRTVNPWTGEVSEPHAYLRLAPTHSRLSETLAALADVPEELCKRQRADRGTKAKPAPIAAELIPPCPEDGPTSTDQRPETLQVARCGDCGSALAAMTEDGELLTRPCSENIGTGNHSHAPGRQRGLAYLPTDIFGAGKAPPVARPARCHPARQTTLVNGLCWLCDAGVRS